MHSESTTQWLSEQEAARARMRSGGATPGFARPDQVTGKTGLEILDAMMAGTLPYPPMNDTMAMTPISAAAGRVIFQGTPEDRHCNPFGTAHGGWFSSLMDSALGCAVQSVLPAGRAYTTVELHINIVRAATPATGPLRAEATVIHAGKQIATAEVRVNDEHGKLYAHGTTTCIVLERP
ncbi:PaaI family thioesterase [Pseudomonadota bacterium AL_CKDN230030165-1A_HGKHYDSX7]